VVKNHPEFGRIGGEGGFILGRDEGRRLDSLGAPARRGAEVGFVHPQGGRVMNREGGFDGRFGAARSEGDGQAGVGACGEPLVTREGDANLSGLKTVGRFCILRDVDTDIEIQTRKFRGSHEGEREPSSRIVIGISNERQGRLNLELCGICNRVITCLVGDQFINLSKDDLILQWGIGEAPLQGALIRKGDGDGLEAGLDLELGAEIVLVVAGGGTRAARVSS